MRKLTQRMLEESAARMAEAQKRDPADVNPGKIRCEDCEAIVRKAVEFNPCLPCYICIECLQKAMDLLREG